MEEKDKWTAEPSEPRETVSEQTATEQNNSENFDELHGENLNDRAKVLSPGMTVLKRFFRSKLSMVGLVTLIVLFLFSFVGPLFSPWGEEDIDKDTVKELVAVSSIQYEVTVTDDEGNQTVQKYIAYDITVTQTETNIKGDITWSHWLGTDDVGRDLFTRLMYGGRVSLTIGFVVVILETLIGVVLGGLAGYFGKWVDQIIMRIVDILYCIPTLPLMLIMSALLDGLGINSIMRLYYMMILLTLIGWAGTARLVRGQILSLREQEFMLAAKCAGLSTHRQIFKHLIPNVMPQLIVSMTLGLGSIILTEATLGYLGLGAPLGTATWGSMIQAATKDEFLRYYPNFWIPPGICITLAILAFNFVGDGLRDAFDPKMKR